MLKKIREYVRKYSWMLLICTLLSGIAGMISVEGIARADEATEKKQQLKALNDQIAAQKKELEAVRDEAAGITAQIAAVDRKIEETESNLLQLAQSIDLTQLEIQNKSAKLVELQEKIKHDQQILGDRLCIIYEEGECSYLDVLLQSSSLQDFLTRVDYLNAILENDQNMIHTTHQLRGEVEVEKAALEVKEEELEAQRLEQAAQKEELEKQRAEHQALFDAIKADLDKEKAALDEMEAESNQLAQLIRNIEMSAASGGIVRGTGQFLWPSNASRTVTSEYGWRFHPTLRYNKLHTGMDIGAAHGTDILAADSGTVIFAGWNNAYGKMTIINHGNNISTLYAHQSSILVSEGQSVYQGQVIGKVGSTGYSTGPHLHFEIRINGETVNPREYL